MILDLLKNFFPRTEINTDNGKDFINTPINQTCLLQNHSLNEKKKKFNLAHIIPHPKLHGLYGLREIIEAIEWGLNELGHDVTKTENIIDTKRSNIIFGAQMLSDSFLEKAPDGTILYNFEQISGINANRLNPVYRVAASNCIIWEYSNKNISKWKEINPKCNVIHVPIGWAPILCRINKPEIQDIDVLIYGHTGQFRLQIFNELCESGLKCMFICGMYGKARDDLIARSKLILNINLIDHSRIFEIVRVSYLLANSKAIVADIREGTHIEKDFEETIAFASPDQIVKTCISLLENDDARIQLEDRGRQEIEKHNIIPILKKALNTSFYSKT